MFDALGYMPMEHVISKFNATNEYPFYNEMKANGTKIIGVWDDHDYGINDGDKTYPFKNQTREVFLDFVGEPHDSPRRLQRNTPIH